MAYSFKRTITCGKATNSDQSTFPLLIKFDSSNVGTTFKTAANGGHIQNTVTQSGGNAVTMPADLIFTSDSAGTTKIPWEVESYDGTNGVLWVWVQIATLTTATNAVIYVFYDDATVSTQQNTGSFSPSNVWDTNFKGVWHLPDGTTLTASDSTSNANNGTLVNSPPATTGQIDGAASISGTSNINMKNITTAASASYNVTNLTLSAWINTTQTSFGPLLDRDDFVNNRMFQFRLTSTGKIELILFNGGNSTTFDSVGTVNNGAFHLITATYNGSNVQLYIDGSLDSTTAYSAALNSVTLGLWLGANIGDNGFRAWYNGTLDEASISGTARSANWIATQYNNQNSPLTFNTIAAESSATASYNSPLAYVGVG